MLIIMCFYIIIHIGSVYCFNCNRYKSNSKIKKIHSSYIIRMADGTENRQYLH